ncbi:MAG: Hsp33 family molecular chaperone HslO [Gammaproteobacteria bacterium]|nr:Hsp33 family molecular chaperone HslO [Gammaproteobacteria bacterium]
MSDADTLQRFVFENSKVRGDFIHLRASYQAVRERATYPDLIAEQLGQALAASALLSATIKFGGSLIMQIQSSGPLNLLVAQCTHDRHLRGLAHWHNEVHEGTLPQMYGDGRLVITIDNAHNNERYQGIVSLEGDTLAEALETYFTQSEQLETRLWLVADQYQAVGMLLQRLPGPEGDDDLWQRVEALGATLTVEEMLQLPTREILRRLFHEEDVRLFDAEPVSFRCSCSREKIVNMLRGLGQEEANAILAEQGKIEVTCEFCNAGYRFDAVDVEEVFTSGLPPPESSSRH